MPTSNRTWPRSTPSRAGHLRPRLARGAFLNQIGHLSQTDRVVNQTSHGGSFLELFHDWFVPRGLYLLDEPEAPLSPCGN